MSEYNFSIPSRQSVKGIVVILGLNIYKFIKHAILAFAVLLFNFIKNDWVIFSPKVIIGIILFLVYIVIVAILKYWNFKFYLNQDYFILKEGILNKDETSIAKSKIQNVYIKQNLIQQLINVVSLSIETAGDDKTEIEIKALPRSKANALKQVLLTNKESQIETDVIEDNITSVYYKASFKKLLLEGISENHLRSFILILFFLLGLYNDVKDIIKEFEISSRFNDLFQLDDEAFLGFILLNIALVIVLLIVAFFFSLIKTLVQNFNLTVYKKDDGLEISKGLFNKINLGLIPSRIQNTTITTNKLKEFLGLYKLSFTQAMVNKKQQLKFNIIGLSKFQVNELINQFYPRVYNDLTKYKPHSFYKRYVVLQYLLFIVIFNVIFFFLSTASFLFNIPLILFAVMSVLYAYKKAYYSLDENYIIVGGGKLITTNTSFLEQHKVQAVELKQSFFQKRRGLASVEIYSASKALTIPYINESDARNIVNYLLYKVESEDRNWM